MKRKLPAVLFILAGCAGAGEDPAVPADGEPEAVEAADRAAPASVLPPDPEDPFFLHPRIIDAAERAAADPDALFQPGATDWDTFEPPLPTAALSPTPTPDEAVTLWSGVLAADDEPMPEVPVETVIRLRDVTDTTATGAVLRFGYMDDSVAGEGWYLGLVRESDGWVVREAGRRWYCRRGVSGDLCL